MNALRASKKWLSLGIGAVVFLAACSSEPAAIVDVEGTVVARVQATMEAVPTNTSIPTVTPTKVPEPTLTPNPSMTPTPTQTPTKTPTPLPADTMTPTATPSVVPTATPVPTLTALPTPVPSSTPTATPTATPSPTPTVPPIDSIVAQVKGAVVKITTETGQGSGVLISADGNILTANHVVDDVEVVNVELLDGRNIEGTVLGRHLAADLAIVNIPLEGLPTIEFGEPDDLHLGDAVFKLGYALGLKGDPSVTVGIVSGFRTDDRYGLPLIQIDAALNPGDSGGPLLNREGLIIGISTSKMVGEAVEAIGFAVEISEAIDHMSRMVASELICPPTPDLAEGQTFRNSIFGYTFTIPKDAGWEFFQDDDGSVAVGRRDGGSASTNLRFSAGVIILTPFDRGDIPSLSVFLDDRIEALPSLVTRIRNVCRTDGSIAYEVEARIVLSNADFTERWLLFFEGGQAYMLIGVAIPEKWDSQEAFIDTVLYSFGFK